MSRGFRVVVDTCVVRSAGSASLGPSKECKDILVAIRDSRTRIAMCKRLLNEWRRHWSALARQWFVEMHARRLVDASFPDVTDVGLSDAVGRAADEHARKPMLKDIHVIELALRSDERIISSDSRAWRHFRSLSSQYRRIAGIMWSRATGKDVEDWIRSGLPTRADLQLSGGARTRRRHRR